MEGNWLSCLLLFIKGGNSGPSDSASSIRAGRQKDQAVESIQSGYKKPDLDVLQPREPEE